MNSAQFQNLMPSKMSDVFRPLVVQQPSSSNSSPSKNGGNGLFTKPYEYPNMDRYSDEEEDLNASPPKVGGRPFALRVLSQEAGNPQ